MTPITEIALESATKAAWLEFLSGYFDGGVHDVGRHTAVAFPRGRIAFDQSPPPRPLSDSGGLEIRVLCLPRLERETWNADAQQGEHLLSTHQVTYQFHVRARAPRPEDAELLADRAAQLLKAILSNPDSRLILARVGITHLSASKPSVIQSTDYAMRIVNCAAQIQYAITTPSTTVPDAIVSTLSWQTLVFRRESPLVNGEYLDGSYEPPESLKLARVIVNALGGTVGSVLALELDGALAGVQVSIPGVPANTPAAADAPLSGPIVPAGARIRWRILSGGEDIAVSHWHVHLTLATTKP